MEKCTYCAMSLVSYAQIQRQVLLKIQKKCDSLLNVGRPMRCLKELIEFTKQALTTRTMYEVWANIGKFLFSSLCTSYDFNGEIKFTVNVRG